MLAQKSDNDLIIKSEKFIIEINHQSGFCFGVVNAIEKAEQNLKSDQKLYSLGSIVHNKQEVSRLLQKGLQIISSEELKNISNKKILFRAHGEPPESYELVNKTGNQLIDATCPVVLKIQQRIKKAYQLALQNNGQIVIFGKPGHAEVIGLVGQTDNTAIVIESDKDFSKINFSQPIQFFSQTTKSLEKFNELAQLLKQQARLEIKINDTICRQVSNRQSQLSLFVKNFDIVFFVGDAESSNSRVLYQVCKTNNSNSFFISGVDEIDIQTLKSVKSIGICGATSTPLWLMKEVSQFIYNCLVQY